MQLDDCRDRSDLHRRFERSVRGYGIGAGWWGRLVTIFSGCRSRWIMNVQIHRVLSDLTGVSGMAMMDAILAGERDGHRLAALRDRRVQASEESIVAAMEGDYRAEHLFTLKQ